MEGLLQGLKHEDVDEQLRVFALCGVAARKAGTRDWRTTQTLHWQGTPLDRHGREYQDLLDEAYASMLEPNPRAARALRETGTARLLHTIGRGDPSETILTRTEFTSRLERLRALRRDDNQQASSSAGRRLHAGG